MNLDIILNIYKTLMHKYILQTVALTRQNLYIRTLKSYVFLDHKRFFFTYKVTRGFFQNLL